MNTQLISCQDFIHLLKQPSPPFILDVRNPDEYQADHLEQAHLIPLPELPSSLQALPEDKNVLIITHCAHGIRSHQAMLFLQNLGYTHVLSLEGGLSALRHSQKTLSHL